jgi:hypothetical protein
MRALFLSLFFSVFFSQAQDCSFHEKPIRELDKADFEKAKSLFIKMLDSPNWKKNDSLSIMLATKYYRADRPEFESESLYTSWIKENLHLTKFASIDEAIFLENELKKTGDEINKENLPLYELLDRASVEQNKIIIKPILINKEY